MSNRLKRKIYVVSALGLLVALIGVVIRISGDCVMEVPIECEVRHIQIGSGSAGLNFTTKLEEVEGGADVFGDNSTITLTRREVDSIIADIVAQESSGANSAATYSLKFWKLAGFVYISVSDNSPTKFVVNGAGDSRYFYDKKGGVRRTFHFAL